MGIALDSSDNSYITGYTSDDLAGTGNAGLYDVFIAKHDTSGIQVWMEQFGTSANDFGYGIAVDSSGNSYVTGYTEGELVGTGTGANDPFIAKHDPSGNQLWVK